MQFQPILNAIDAIIKDSSANAFIKLYRMFVIEPGAHGTPICLIGSSRSAKLSEDYLPASGGNNPRLWDFSIGVSILSRRYPLPAQIAIAAQKVDECQAAVFTALQENSTLNNSVTHSWVEAITEISLLQGEYWGYQIMLSGQTFESGS